MAKDPGDVALHNLEQLLSRDPLLRDLVHPVLPGIKKQSRFSPDVDVTETDSAWVLQLEVPGTPRSAIKVELDGARLVVSGDKPRARLGKVRTGERAFGPFKREFIVPFEVDQGAIQAKLEHGVLTITLPRLGDGKPRAVPID